MADILIRGMEMPESCHVCVAGYGGCCYVAPPEEDGICPNEGRPNWCPLIALPEGHGDLIDKDETMNTILGEPTDAHYPSWYAGIVNDMPAIVPAEKEVRDGDV